MFHKISVFMLVSGFTGLVFAESHVPQSVTSEVFSGFEQRVVEDNYEYATQPMQFNQSIIATNDNQDDEIFYQETYEEYRNPVTEQNVPVWPLAGSDADVEIACGGAGCGDGSTLVAKDGNGLVIQNNINASGTGWSGGPSISHDYMIPVGFDYECANDAEMPLMRREMMEDDGGSVLAMSRSPRKNCNTQSDSYTVFAQRAGFVPDKTCNKASDSDTSIAVNEYVDEDNSGAFQDQVRSWVVVSGQTLREVLQNWCDKSGWDLVWTTSREYPIEASAVFKGRFMDVASALVRNFERATPIPYAKFYKGNRVVVVSTSEE